MICLNCKFYDKKKCLFHNYNCSAVDYCEYYTKKGEKQ